MITQEKLFVLIRQTLSGIAALIGAVREKGMGYYERPLIIAGACSVAVYFLIYRVPTVSLNRSRSEISTLSAITQYTGRYRELKDLLESYYTSLPKLKDKDRDLWLTETVRDAMKAEGLFFISLSPATEQVQGYYAQVSVNVTCRLQYKQLASWVARLERSSHAVRISRLGLNKDNSDIGINSVEITVSAVFPTEGEGS